MDANGNTTYGFSIPADLKLALKRMADDDDRTISKFIQLMIESEARRRNLLPEKHRSKKGQAHA